MLSNDNHEDLPSQQLHHQQSSLGPNAVEKTISKWSDDDSGMENDEDDNAWLVTTSASSSTSSDHSLYSDDDENDVESIACDNANDHNRTAYDVTSALWKNDENNLIYRHHRHYQCNDANADHHPDTNIIFYNLEQYQIPKNQNKFDVASKIHNYLSLYSEFITQAKNQEILLKLLQWSLWLIGACIVPTSSASHLLPQWMKKLSYDVCYARYVTRLLGLPVALEGAISGSWATTCSVQPDQSLNTTYRYIGLLLAYSMVLYYPAEHIAFFLWMNPNAETIMSLPAETWFYLSMRCWLVYLFVEIVQCVLKYNELRQCHFTMQKPKKTDVNNTEHRHYHARMNPPQQHHQRIGKNSTSEESTHYENQQQHRDEDSHCADTYYSKNSDIDSDRNGITLKELNNEIYNVLLLLIRNFLYIGPCIHWSMSTWDTQPILPDIALNGLMWLESIICLYQVIHNKSTT